ncbi:hypothetical protein ABPG74_018045 [Tetrahymena malaccensis]
MNKQPSQEKFQKERDHWLTKNDQEEITLSSLSKNTENQKMKQNNYRKNGLVSGTIFFNETSAQKQLPNQINQNMANSYQINQNASPSSYTFQNKSKKLEEEIIKNGVRASISSSENQQDQDETIRNIVHKVEIDSEGIIQEKTYKQVMDQQIQRENHLKHLQNKYRQNLIKVEENEDDKSSLNQQKSAQFNKIKESDNFKNQNQMQVKSKAQQDLQLNYSYVSFDDNGENFMTNQTEEQSEFNTKQSFNNKNKFSSVSSSSTGIYQKKIDEIQQELKEKISFLIALEEELLETKTQLNMQKLENSSHKERINKLQKDNHLMQKQITQMGETIKNLEKASNSLVNQILLIKNNNEMNSSKEHQSSINNLNDSCTNPLATYQEYLNDIVKSNINLRISLEELNQKYGQLKSQINTTVFTHSSPVSTRSQNLQLESNLSTNKYRSSFLKEMHGSNEDRRSVSPSNVSTKSRTSMSPIQGGMNIDEYEKNLSYSKQHAQYSLQGRVREIKDACDKFVNKYLKNKRRNCSDEQERQFFVELDNEFQLINNNIQKMESYLEEIKFESESRVKNARQQFETTLKEIEQIKKIAEERNKILIDQVKQIEQQNISLNKTVENYKGSLMENEKGLDESRLKLETYQKSTEDYQTMLKQVNETLALKNEEIIQMKLYRDNLEQDLNNKVQNIKELKLENNENSQFIRKLQEQIIALQKEIQEKHEALSKSIEFAQQLREESERKASSIQRDNYQAQNKEKEFLEKEIKFKERENQLLNELSQRDSIISNLQDQINELNQSHLINKIESENQCLKTELDNLKQIKSEFENNFNILQTQIIALKSENKELKNDEVERKLLQYEKYIQLEQKLGLQQTDILLLVEKLPLAEQELQNIVALNEKLQNEINKLKQEKTDSEKGQKDWKNKYEKSNLDVKHIQEQFNQERDLLMENIKQQIQMNQQLQKQNQTIMKNCEITKQSQINLESQIKNLTEENELLSQKCIKLEDCLNLLVKERELIKKQQNDTKLKEFSSSEQNLIQSLNSASQKQFSQKNTQKNNKKDQLRISTSKDQGNQADKLQTSVSPSNSRSSKQSLQVSKSQNQHSSAYNANNNQINNSKQMNQQSINSVNKQKQSQNNQNLSNSIQSQSSSKNFINTNRSQSQLTSSQQIKQIQQFHAMQGIQQHQLASLSPMSQQKYQQTNNQSVQSNTSGKNSNLALQSISPKNILRSQELKQKQVTEKENNFCMQQEQSIKISQLIQSNQLNNNNSLIQSISGNLFTPNNRNQNALNSSQNLQNSQNLRQSNQNSNCEYTKENSNRPHIVNQLNNYQQDNVYPENKFSQQNENTYIFEESGAIQTNRIPEQPSHSQNEDCKITSDEGYSNTMHTINYYEDSNNQQWNIKSLRDHPYEIVKKDDKNMNQTFAEADQYEDFEERQDFDHIQQQQKERFEREINQREQEQKDLFQNNQKYHQNNNQIQDIEQNQIWNEQQNKQNMFENQSENDSYQQQLHQQGQQQIRQIHEGFSFNNEMQRGKFMFQQQLNNINFSDEAFQTEQYSFN